MSAISDKQIPTFPNPNSGSLGSLKRSPNKIAQW